MRRSSASLLVLAFMLCPVIAQTPGNSPDQSNCSLTSASAIRGIRLGMTAEELFALIPGAGERMENKETIAAAQQPGHYGVVDLSFSRLSYPSPAWQNFSGIDSISITLFDGHVSVLRIEYAGPGSRPRGPAWNYVGDFIAKLSESLGLPEQKYWVDNGSNQKAIKCGSVDIEATNRGGQGLIRLHQDGYLDTVRQRAMADEDKRRREFKP